MTKKIILMLLLIILFGCSNKPNIDNQNNNFPNNNDNQIDVELENYNKGCRINQSNIIFNNADIREVPDDSFGRGFYTYMGSQIEIEVNLTIHEDSVNNPARRGFMLFLEGEPQSFYLADGTYIDSMYILDVPVDPNTNNQFYVYYEPSYGEVGDELELTFTFIRLPKENQLNSLFARGCLYESIITYPFFIEMEENRATGTSDKNYYKVGYDDFNEQEKLPDYNDNVVIYLHPKNANLVKEPYHVVSVNKGERVTFEGRVASRIITDTEYRLALFEYDGTNGKAIDIFENKSYLDVIVKNEKTTSFDIEVDTSNLDKGLYNYFLIGTTTCDGYVCNYPIQNSEIIILNVK